MNEFNLIIIISIVYLSILNIKNEFKNKENAETLKSINDFQKSEIIDYSKIDQMKYSEICDLVKFHKEKLFVLDEALKKIDKSVGTSSSSSSTYTKPKQ